MYSGFIPLRNQREPHIQSLLPIHVSLSLISLLPFSFSQYTWRNFQQFQSFWSIFHRPRTWGSFKLHLDMAGCKIYLKKRKADWLSSLLQSKFFGSCVHHQNNRKNEKNVFCIDCGIAICRHCLISHCVHRRLQICKYVYQYVVRVPDLQNHLDCCNIQVIPMFPS